MAHHEEQPTAIESVLELLSEHGLGAMAEAMQTLLNEAMKLERSDFLRASPGERTDERTGYANGFKGKALRTRIGELALRVPQVRALPGGESLGFYPKSLERGLRSERAEAGDCGDVRPAGVDPARDRDHARAVRARGHEHGRVARGGRARRATRGLAGASARALCLPDSRRALREGPPRRLRDRLRRADRDGGPGGGRQADAARRLGVALGGRGALARVSRRASQARPRSDDAHHERRPCGPASRAARRVPESAVAALPVPPAANRELHRRTRVATLFPNEGSLLRLVSAMTAEISEEWETGRAYLNMESE